MQRLSTEDIFFKSSIVSSANALRHGRVLPSKQFPENNMSLITQQTSFDLDLESTYQDKSRALVGGFHLRHIV